MCDSPYEVWWVACLKTGDRTISIGIAAELYRADGWGFHICLRENDDWRLIRDPCARTSDKALHWIRTFYSFLPGFEWCGPIVTVINSKLSDLSERYGQP